MQTHTRITGLLRQMIRKRCSRLLGWWWCFRSLPTYREQLYTQMFQHFHISSMNNHDSMQCILQRVLGSARLGSLAFTQHFDGALRLPWDTGLCSFIVLLLSLCTRLWGAQGYEGRRMRWEVKKEKDELVVVEFFFFFFWSPPSL